MRRGRCYEKIRLFHDFLRRIRGQGVYFVMSRNLSSKNLPPGISASKTPLWESYTRTSDITVGRETAEFWALRRAILTETVLCPKICAGIKNIEAPLGTVSQTR